MTLTFVGISISSSTSSPTLPPRSPRLSGSEAFLTALGTA